MKTTFTPDNYRLTYTLETVKKTFHQFKLHSADRAGLLPDLIRLEKNNGYNSTTGAENLLKIRDTTNWSKCTITGLRPTETPNFYYADLKIKEKKSLFVVYISDDRETIYIRICPQFYPYNATERNRIVKHLIDLI